MKRWIKRIGIFVLVLLALVGLGRITGKAREPALGVLEVNGTLWVADDWVEKIEEFRKNPKILGVVVRINSPGGTVAASQEIYSALKKLAAKKPVVASMGTVAASGGLYLAMAANKILADEGTLTGSIGVRMEHVHLEELLKFAKIGYDTIKSGKLKDIGSFTRPLSQEEREFLEAMMGEIHLQFKEVVAKERGIKMEELEKFADGRILTGAKAKALHLIDEIGGFTRAVEVAAELSGIKGEPRLVYGDKQYAWWIKAIWGTWKVAFSGPIFCYLYN